MEALAAQVEPFCKIWPCGTIVIIGALIIGAIITYFVMTRLLNYRKPNKL